MLLQTEFIGQTFHVRLRADSQDLSNGSSTPQQGIPFGVCRHVAPQRFTEKLTDGSVLALGKLLRLNQ